MVKGFAVGRRLSGIVVGSVGGGEEVVGGGGELVVVGVVVVWSISWR